MQLKTFLIITICLVSCGLFSACTEEDWMHNTEKSAKEILDNISATIVSENCDSNCIIPLDGDSIAVRQQRLKTRSKSPSYTIAEEINQLDQVPVYLRITGNTSDKHFLNVKGAGEELTFESYKDKDKSQQFYIKVLPAYMGVPCMIYSVKTNSLISIGSYPNNPDTKVVYAQKPNTTSTFGASWDIRRGQYSTNSFILENQDYPRQGTGNALFDIYYSVIAANNSKVTLEKYNRSPQQEFTIIPAEDFRVESVTFDPNTSTVTNTPYTIFSDSFSNNGSIEQQHTFSVSESYKVTSSFNQRTSYNVNLSTKLKVKIPVIVGGGIDTSIAIGKDFTYGETEERTTTINKSYNITVPAKTKARIVLKMSRYTMDVEYCAVCVGVTSGRRLKIRGVWKGVEVQETDANLELIIMRSRLRMMIPITNDMIAR